jgi:hypothetical protein
MEPRCPLRIVTNSKKTNHFSALVLACRSARPARTTLARWGTSLDPDGEDFGRGSSLVGFAEWAEFRFPHESLELKIRGPYRVGLSQDYPAASKNIFAHLRHWGLTVLSLVATSRLSFLQSLGELGANLGRHAHACSNEQKPTPRRLQSNRLRQLGCSKLHSGPGLLRRQGCARRRFQHELIIHDGPIDGQLRYFKLDGVFLLWSPDLYVRWEKHPIEFPIFVVQHVGDDRPVFIQDLLVWLQISSVPKESPARRE